ncbi:MAG: radical SAM protein [Bacillota bacterium]
MDKDLKLAICATIRIREENDYALMFNSDTYRILKISKAVFNILSKIDQEHFSYNDFVAAGMNDEGYVYDFFTKLCEDCVVEYYNAEKKYVKRVFELRSEKLLFQAPNMVWWDITAYCNLGCYYCYSAAGKKSADELSFEEAINIISELNNMGIFYIFFLGGEPFSKEGFMNIVKHAVSLGIAVMVSTNGYFVNKEMIASLNIFTNVRVSLDSGVRETHNRIRGNDTSYDIALEALDIFRLAGVKNLGINCTVGQDNLNELKDVFAVAKRFKCNQIQFIPIAKSGRGLECGKTLNDSDYIIMRNEIAEINTMQLTDSEQDAIYIQAPSDNTDESIVLDAQKYADIIGCAAGKTCAAIYDNGDIGYCLMYREPIGTIRTKSFSSIWSEQQMLNKTKDELCKGCINLNCYGSCKVK